MTRGTFALVLHSHLPWVAHHGRWPVGEEWLYQAWSHAYLPVIDVVQRLAAEGRTDLLTLGITPILAAQLDDPSCIESQRTWLADWAIRAGGSAAAADPDRARMGQREYRDAQRAQTWFENHWQRGASPVIRQLAVADAIEVLGGPATHPFLPLLDEEFVDFALRVGIDDGLLRRSQPPGGIWAPECGYRPGLETHYARAGITHFLVDGPTLGKLGTDQPVLVGESDVVAFARNLEITYRVWSPRRGYPGGRWYRDFHTFDHHWGLRPARVTSTSTEPAKKAPYEPERAAVAVQADAKDFIAHVVEWCAQRPDAVVVAAYDTELFGHWWHEGPAFLEAILRGLPEAGVNVTTLRHLADRATTRVNLPAGSWGSGKDWRVWDGEQVHDIVTGNQELQHQARSYLAKIDPSARNAVADQVLREVLLALSSDWAFMITKDSAAAYARSRFTDHAAQARELMTHPDQLEQSRHRDGPFGHLDARLVR
jgi:1,4-alpha-glucan branching enzyme